MYIHLLCKTAGRVFPGAWKPSWCTVSPAVLAATEPAATDRSGSLLCPCISELSCAQTSIGTSTHPTAIHLIPM